MSTVADYLKHAKRYGPELVYETAVGGTHAGFYCGHGEGWDAAELADLVAGLRRIAPAWNLSAEQRRDLALRLLRAGESISRLRTSLGLTGDQLDQILTAGAA